MKIHKFNYILVALVSFLLILPSYSAPQKNLWSRWQKHVTRSPLRIDHSKWQFILSEVVKKSDDDINLVDYLLLKNKQRKVLREYLEAMRKIDIDTYSRNEQLAYWINLYNAITVNVVVNNLPVISIKNIGASLFSSGPWDQKVFTLYDERLTLNDIEHRILRPIWNDSRIHYGLNCASIGCPNLMMQAYTGDNVNSLLDQAAKNFINSERGVNINDGRLSVSEIYNWYAGDFGSNEKELLTHIMKYADSNLREKINSISKITDYFYDWRLNCYNC